jgi:ABC-2 type transport system ATP-binding protein
MYAIEARGLTKRFKDVHAVNDIDLLVEEGDVVGLLGPNGAGKTTTLMMLLGITEPDAGSVSLLGERLPERRTQALLGTNFAASYLGLPDRLKVIETMRVFADLYGAPRTRADEVLERFEIEHLRNRFPSELSSGQKTIVTVARSLINRPRLLVLDEPTASLDPEVAHRMREVLTGVHADERFTLLITSHNMADIERMCTRVVFIAGGRIVADDSPAAVSAAYGGTDLEAAFLSIAAEVRA